MAETSDKAFGRYLRTLRERRGLALHDVASLSSSFPEAITKGYLSRCENGYLTPSFSKVIALSRIYEVPADVLVERMELDMELDRLGSPSTEGMSFTELVDAGRDALRKGQRWHAYGFLRDATRLASEAPVRSSYRDIAEQVTSSFQHVGTAAKALGRVRFPLHEFLYAETTETLSPRFRALIKERIACCHRSLGRLELASTYSEEAVVAAEACDGIDCLGFIYATRAHIALCMSNSPLAIEYYTKAYKAHRRAAQLPECAVILGNLSQCFFDENRFTAASRSARASLQAAMQYGQHRTVALAHIMLGDLCEKAGRRDAAKSHWKEARELAERIHDREVRFKADFVLFRQALQTDNTAVARSIQRRMIRQSPWIPPETVELAEFKRLSNLTQSRE